MEIRQLNRIAELKESQWERLERHDNPFLSWQFLNSLEKHIDLEYHGWQARHIVALKDNELIAAIPLYIKTNSHGEFVFDWVIADAYQQAGLKYYPKYVSAVPFTPVTGERILSLSGSSDRSVAIQKLIQTLLNKCISDDISSVNFLFCNQATQTEFSKHHFAARHTWQYRWRNHNYHDFEQFLQQLNSKRRKQIRRERRSIQQQKIQIRILEGNDINHEHWSIFHEFYCSTFVRKWGEPRFTLTFFRNLSATMPGSITLFLALKNGRYVAGAFAMKSKNTLYGRHWGCNSWHKNLHFELCYYQTIDYCIRHGLKYLDAGVQGEHKMMRGFFPVRATSMCWYRQPEFMRAIRNYFLQETDHVDAQISTLIRHSAYHS